MRSDKRDRKRMISLALDGYRRDIYRRDTRIKLLGMELPELKPGFKRYTDTKPFLVNNYDPSTQKNFTSVVFDINGANEPRLSNLVNALPIFDENLDIIKYDIPLLFGVPDTRRPTKGGEYSPLVRVAGNQLWFEVDAKLAIKTMERVLKTRRHSHDITKIMPIPVEVFLSYEHPSPIDLGNYISCSWRPKLSSPLPVEDRQMIRELVKLGKN